MQVYLKIGLFLLLVLLVCPAAFADAMLLEGNDHPTLPSSFTLDFGDYGGERTAQITSTYFLLEIDPDAQSAQYVDYHQDVDPLELPGGYSTGNMIIEIVESNPGTYDESTGVFTSDDLYAIHFDGDLSMFGLESPFYLPSISEGVLVFDDAESGSAYMEWAGAGELPNPDDPDNPIVFSYTCVVNAQFVVMPEPASLALALVGSLALLRRRNR